MSRTSRMDRLPDEITDWLYRMLGNREGPSMQEITEELNARLVKIFGNREPEIMEESVRRWFRTKQTAFAIHREMERMIGEAVRHPEKFRDARHAYFGATGQIAFRGLVELELSERIDVDTFLKLQRAMEKTVKAEKTLMDMSFREREWAKLMAARDAAKSARPADVPVEPEPPEAPRAETGADGDSPADAPDGGRDTAPDISVDTAGEGATGSPPGASGEIPLQSSEWAVSLRKHWFPSAGFEEFPDRKLVQLADQMIRWDLLDVKTKGALMTSRIRLNAKSSPENREYLLEAIRAAKAAVDALAGGGPLPEPDGHGIWRGPRPSAY